MKKIVLILVLLVTAAVATYFWKGEPQEKFSQVFQSPQRWTGIALSDSGRVFVNYPRWSKDLSFSVAEMVDGKPVAFPDAKWNSWNSEIDAKERFVGVQSVHVDGSNTLWILDTGNPFFSGVVPGGAKVVKVSLSTNSVEKVFFFPPEVATPNSYVNDIRVDLRNGFAYFSESGEGSLVVFDMGTEEFRRVLAKHPSTHWEGITLTIEGKPWLNEEGKAPQIHADGIAYDPKGDWVYYQALSGRTLYRIPAKLLRDFTTSEKALEDAVERVAEVGASDGIIFDIKGNLILSSLEKNAIRRLTPAGKIETLVEGPEISWPDSFAFAPDGSLYFTTTQIHRGEKIEKPFGIFRLVLPKN